MNRITAAWFNFWKRKKILFLSHLAVIISLLVFSTKNLVVYEDITKTLPESEDFQKLAEIFEHKGINSTVYFSIEPANSLSTEEYLEIGNEFTTDLQKTCGRYIKNSSFQLEQDELSIYDFVNTRIPYYLSEDDYKSYNSQLNYDSINFRIMSNHEKLFTPEGFFLKKFLMADPLSITAQGLKGFEKAQGDNSFVVEDGIFLMPDKKSLFVSAELGDEVTDGKTKELVANQFEELKSRWNSNYKFDYFSSFLVANENSKQVKKDTQLTLWISLAAIISLLVFYYRSLVLPLFFVVPAILGLLFAIALITLVKGEISAISIGAGAIVLGIIMDYSFHFFTHLKHSSSIEETIKDVTAPLLTGCLTTVLAFLALIFTNSPVLQDFGLFSSFSLIGAALSVLLVLPIILPKKLEQKWKDHPERSIKIKLPRFLKVGLTIFILGFTVVAIMFAGGIQFDDDLMNLNYYPDELKESEKKFNNIDPNSEKRVFIIAEAESKEEAASINFEVYTDLRKLQDDEKISGYLNTGIFEIPAVEQKQKLEKWNSFWGDKSVALGNQLDSLEEELGYYENTFDDFKTKISGSYKIEESAATFPVGSSDLEKLVDSSNGTWKYISYLTVKSEDKDKVVNELKSRDNGSFIVDRGEIAGSLIKTVQADFNYILIASSVLVLGCLLIVYGRIEIALITFLPMILSWIWILGLAAMLGIKFNFVNIIISTFIFGLGDDFAIFITDGFVSKFARNKDVIKPYRRGILLSATTTIIGTGVLIFAKHPAINSIALIAVIGMLAILFISFTVQPYLLKKVLTERKNKGLPPISLMNLLSTVFSFGFFLGGCIALYPIQLIFRLIPFGQKKLKLFYHHLIRIFAWLLVHTMFNVKKRFYNKERLDFNNPSIIIANHQSFIDVIVMMSLHPKVLILTNDWVYNSPFFGAQIRYLGFLPGSEGVENNIEKLKPFIEDGYSVVVFPEGTRSTDKKIGRFHKGAFFLAQEFNMDITPVILHGYNDTMRKNDYILLNGTLNTAILPRISNEDLSYGESYKERCKNISTYFKMEFRAFDLEKSDSKYLQSKIISNYIFKSPFIEWYVKVKWMFERKNFDFYHGIIPTSGKILDLGCGYGYLSYYLQNRANEREIIGVDYDADKIEIANNCYSKNDKINFESADIRDLEIRDASAVFLNDVVHYLPEEDHEPLLQKCLDGINKGGVLIVRDGITDLEDRHKKTELTEKYSTQIIGFNKVSNGLCFFSKEFIEKFAQKNGCTCEVKEQSSKTSNILFIIKK